MSLNQWYYCFNEEKGGQYMLKVEELIKNKGIKKAYILKQLEMSAPTLNKKMNDPSSFTIKEYRKICEIFGTDTDTIKSFNALCE